MCAQFTRLGHQRLCDDPTSSHYPSRVVIVHQRFTGSKLDQQKSVKAAAQARSTADAATAALEKEAKIDLDNWKLKRLSVLRKRLLGESISLFKPCTESPEAELQCAPLQTSPGGLSKSKATAVAGEVKQKCTSVARRSALLLHAGEEDGAAVDESGNIQVHHDGGCRGKGGYERGDCRDEKGALGITETERVCRYSVYSLY